MGKLVHFGNYADQPKTGKGPSQEAIPGAASLQKALDPAKYKHPSGIEPLEIAAYESFTRGEVIKLVMSAPQTENELLSMLKAVTYMQVEIERLSKGTITIEINKLDEEPDEDDES